ncbi:hypothetical protein HOY80DRAFT_269907 [Tuber brumale]|nr:hypothetical protein HOY80DRAFT_269907 [Tuber brumale]
MIVLSFSSLPLSSLFSPFSAGFKHLGGLLCLTQVNLSICATAKPGRDGWADGSSLSIITAGQAWAAVVCYF